MAATVRVMHDEHETASDEHENCLRRTVLTFSVGAMAPKRSASGDWASSIHLGCPCPFTVSHDNIKTNASPAPPTALPSSGASAFLLCLPTSLAPNVLAAPPLLDAEGDHLFSCKHHHKGRLSNAIRDTIYHLLRILAPLAAFADSVDSISLETPQLAPTNDLRKQTPR